MVRELREDERVPYLLGALEQARERIEATVDAYRRGNTGPAIASLYYAYFHLVKALLYQRGLDPRTHEGVYTLLNLHFVRAGHLGREYSRLFERLHKSREVADYNPLAPRFTREDVVAFVQEFLEKVPTLLRGILRQFSDTPPEVRALERALEELRTLPEAKSQS